MLYLTFELKIATLITQAALINVFTSFGFSVLVVFELGTCMDGQRDK